MKYTQLISYKKHLQSAYPDHFAPLYGIALSNAFERKILIEGTLKYMKVALEHVSWFSREEGGFFQIEEELQSQDLFSSFQSPIIIDHAEKLSKEEFQVLERSGRAILLGFAKTSPLLRSLEKEGVVLDLLSEKPWDRQKRWIEQLRLKEAVWKKKIPDGVLERIVFLAHDDFAIASQELEKVLCYTAQKPSVTLQDLEAISQKGRVIQAKELVEKFVWGFSLKSTQGARMNADYFFSWLFFMKEEMRLGLKVKELLLADPKMNLVPFFPKVWPRTLEKKKQASQQRTKEFFLHGLRYLYEIEMMAKDQAPNYAALIDLYNGKLQCLHS